MKRTIALSVSALLVLCASTASAQLTAAKDGPIVYGHHHINAANPEETKKFFVNTLGGVLIKVGTNNQEIIKFPNVLIFMRTQAPKGGTIGSSVDHIGFGVPNLRGMVDKIKAGGYKMITATEVAAGREVKDDIAGPAAPGGASIAYAMGPDEVKVEFVEVKAQTLPIALHHIHFFGQKNAEMQAWYAKVFGAKLGNPGGAFLSATLPGVTLNFSPSTDPVVGTTGRGLDHIGFEIKNLEAFTKKLGADGIKLTVPYRQVPALNIGLAFITDPWGTYIELNEGLDKLS